jgi:hypothetical protein
VWCEECGKNGQLNDHTWGRIDSEIAEKCDALALNRQRPRPRWLGAVVMAAGAIYTIRFAR